MGERTVVFLPPETGVVRLRNMWRVLYVSHGGI